MHNELRGTWLHRKALFALPAAAALLTLAPAAHAFTATPDPTPSNYPSLYSPTSPGPVVETAANVSQLQSDVAGAQQGSLTIIVLKVGTIYTVTSPLDILPGTDVEITGPPTLQATSPSNNTAPVISGLTLYANYLGSTNPIPEPTIYVEPGGYGVLKAIQVEFGGTNQGEGAVEVGGQAEIDNVAIFGPEGTGLTLDDGGNATMTNSNITQGNFDGIEMNGQNPAPDGGLTLVNDTIAENQVGGIISGGEQTLASYNTIFANNDESNTGATEAVIDDPTTFTGAGNYSDDGSFPSGTTDSSTLDSHLPTFLSYLGGPTEVLPEKAGAPTIGKGVATYCPTADQRFFLYTKGTGGTCDVGSYQSTGVQDTSTTGPTVASLTKNESANSSIPSTETVKISESGTGAIGIGGDVVNNYAIGSTYTSQGSVGFPTWGGSLFNSVNSISAAPLYPTTASYAVTATKADGDLTVGDTKWSFYATDWLGNFNYEN